MKQKNKTRLARAAMTLLLALLTTFGAWAQTTVTIGEGTATSNTNPIGTYYNFSITEQLYTAEEIGMAGTISSISFYYMGLAEKDLPITVYMKHVDEENLASAGISLADADEVFSGTLSVTTTAGWVTIDLDTPFDYDGTSNLLIGIIKDYLYYFSGQSWQGTATFATMARYSQNDDNSYDTSTVPGTAQANRPNIQMEITPSGVVVTCFKPQNLQATLTQGNGTIATLTWERNANGTEDAWVLEYGTAADFTGATSVNVTGGNPSKDLTGLTPENTYYARVKPECDTEGTKWSNIVTFTPTNTYSITINDGTATNSYVPFYGLYADSNSDSQFIIPASDLAAMQWGYINNIKLYFSTNSATWNGAVYDVYVTEVSNAEFANAALDFSGMTKVYTGSVSVVDGILDLAINPYQYMGGNLLIGFDETTNSSNYPSGSWKGVTTTTNTAVYQYNNGNITLAKFLPKTTFAYTPGEAPSCPKPTGLTVNYTGGTTAEVSWTSDADNWQLAFVDGEGTITSVSTVSENPYTLTGLELGTTYRLAIRTVCGEGSYSEWTSLTSPVTFTTDLCMPENQCNITLVLTDSYGDGWNGNAIQVVDVETGMVLGQFANENLDGETGEETQAVTFAVCDGREIQFQWVKGSYPDEASWVITDINDEVICEGTGTSSMNTGDVLATYTVNCTVTSCRRPTDLAASEIGPHSAKLSWRENGEATAWVVAYTTDGENYTELAATSDNPFTLTGLDTNTYYGVKVRPVCDDSDDKWSDEINFTTTSITDAKPYDLSVTPYPNKADVTWKGFAESYNIEWAEKDYTPSDNALWLQYDDGTYATSIGNSSEGTWEWGVMYPATQLNGNSYLNKIAIYEEANYYTMDSYTVNVYTGGDDAPETLVGTETVAPSGQNGIHEITLTTPITIDSNENLWITVTAYGTYVLTSCATNEANNQWVNNGGTWVNIGDIAPSLANYGWMIRGFIDSTVPTYDWTSVSGVTSPYTITGLQPETDYVVKVQGDFGTDGTSNWTWAYFTTPSVCEAPIDLAATDVTADAATLSWTGYQDNYNVRYRSLGTPLFEDYFTNGMDNWTTIDADGDGYTWVLGSECGGVYLVEGGSLSNTGHNASGDMVASGSYSNMSGVGALTPDNYLVSPQVTLGGSITFWACAQDASYPAEHFGVAVSTTGNTDAADFTTIAEWTMTADGSGTEGGAKVQGSWGKFTVDLSAYAGQDGYVAIRHFDCTDKFMLIVDDIVISAPQNNTWVDLTSDDTSIEISGLAPDTEYEWQVQGINAGCDGGVTAWSETATFTTWGVEDILFAKDGYATYYNSIRDVVLPEGMKAHVVTAGSTTLTYNKVADGDEENNVVPAGTAMLLQVEEAAADHSISVYLARPSVAAYTGTNLMFGSDVETTTTGGDKYYKLTYSSSGTNFGWYWGAANGIAFSSPAHKAWLALPASGAPSFLGLPDWDTTGIVPVGVNPEDGEWYTLQGMKVGKKPTTAGVYIHNGKKFVIK